MRQTIHQTIGDCSGLKAPFNPIGECDSLCPIVRMLAEASSVQNLIDPVWGAYTEVRRLLFTAV
jgi:hypothetical protein